MTQPENNEGLSGPLSENRRVARTCVTCHLSRRGLDVITKRGREWNDNEIVRRAIKLEVPAGLPFMEGVKKRGMCDVPSNHPICDMPLLGV